MTASIKDQRRNSVVKHWALLTTIQQLSCSSVPYDVSQMIVMVTVQIMTKPPRKTITFAPHTTFRDSWSFSSLVAASPLLFRCFGAQQGTSKRRRRTFMHVQTDTYLACTSPSGNATLQNAPLKSSDMHSPNCLRSFPRYLTLLASRVQSPKCLTSGQIEAQL